MTSRTIARKRAASASASKTATRHRRARTRADESRNAMAGQYLPTGVLPEEAFRAIGRLRREARDEIDRLLAFLDTTQPDADLEPSLGSSAAHEWYSQAGWATGTADDREDEHDGKEPDHGEAEPDNEGEPTLGSLESVINQDIAWHEPPVDAFLADEPEADPLDMPRRGRRASRGGHAHG